MDDQRVDEVFERIAEMDLELDYDPIERGPKFLNNMVAKCRNFTNEVQRFARECQMYLRTIERELRTLEADFEIQYNDLLSNDPEIISMRGLSRADREALARTKLQEEVERINTLQLALTDAGHVETVIDSKLRELRDVNRDIRLQKQLIQSEIETGAMWGNDMGAHDSKHLTTDDMDFEDVFEAPPEEEVPEASEPDYEDLFVISDDNEVDTGENDVTIVSDNNSERDPARPEINEPTTIYDDVYEDGDLDFSDALDKMG